MFIPLLSHILSLSFLVNCSTSLSLFSLISKMGMIIVFTLESSYENQHVKCLTHCLAYTNYLKIIVIFPYRQNHNYFIAQLSTNEINSGL